MRVVLGKTRNNMSCISSSSVECRKQEKPLTKADEEEEAEEEEEEEQGEELDLEFCL